MPRAGTRNTNLRGRLFKLFEHKCFYCKTHLNTHNRTVDHVVARRRKEKYPFLTKIILPACKGCNNHKADQHFHHCGGMSLDALIAYLHYIGYFSALRVQPTIIEGIYADLRRYPKFIDEPKKMQKNDRVIKPKEFVTINNSKKKQRKYTVRDVRDNVLAVGD